MVRETRETEGEPGVSAGISGEITVAIAPTPGTMPLSTFPWEGNSGPKSGLY